MSGPITVIPPRQSLVDDRGHITRVWWLFLQEIFTRIGGANAMTNIELQDLAFSLTQSVQPAAPPEAVLVDVVQPVMPSVGGVFVDVVQPIQAQGLTEVTFQC